MKKMYGSLLGLGTVLSLIIAFIYFTKAAGSLPHFFPGYSAGSSHMHTKHGILFVVLAIVLALIAWMISAPKTTSSGPVEHTEN